MGASSSVDEAQFNALKNTVNSQAGKINALDALKSKVDNLSTAAASGIEYTKLAEAINKEANYRENLAKEIAKNPNELGANLAAEIGKNNSIIENLNSKLGASTTLQDKVADTLSSNDKYKERIRGPKGVDGSIGDQASLKSNLFDKGNTMWCADGELCKIPDKKKGIQTPHTQTDSLSIGKWRIHADDHALRFFENGVQKYALHGGAAPGEWKDRLWSSGPISSLNWNFQQHPNGNLHIHQGNVDDWSAAVTTYNLHARKGMHIHEGSLHGGNVVKTDAEYAIRATRPSNDHDWVYLTRHDEWNGHRGKNATYHAGKGEWQRFKFEQY
jgi:hypothetical protein